MSQACNWAHRLLRTKGSSPGAHGRGRAWKLQFVAAGRESSESSESKRFRGCVHLQCFVGKGLSGSATSAQFTTGAFPAPQIYKGLALLGVQG